MSWYFLSFYNTMMAHAAKIIPSGRQWPVYPANCMPWLLITWLHKEPGHQQPSCWLSYHICSSFRRVNTNTRGISSLQQLPTWLHALIEYQPWDTEWNAWAFIWDMPQCNIAHTIVWLKLNKDVLHSLIHILFIIHCWGTSWPHKYFLMCHVGQAIKMRLAMGLLQLHDLTHILNNLMLSTCTWQCLDVTFRFLLCWLFLRNLCFLLHFLCLFVTYFNIVPLLYVTWLYEWII